MEQMTVTAKIQISASTDDKVLLDETMSVYSELVAIGEIETSLKIGGFIKDVSMELERAESMKINLDSVDYAMDCILDVQQQLHDEFKAKE